MPRSQARGRGTQKEREEHEAKGVRGLPECRHCCQAWTIALQIDYRYSTYYSWTMHKCGMPSTSAGMRHHSAPRNSPLRHTAASVQITVALSILHPKSGGDPDDPSQA